MVVFLAVSHLPMTEAENRFKHDCSKHGMPSFWAVTGFFTSAYVTGTINANSKGIRLRMSNLFAAADYSFFGSSLPEE